MVTSIKTKKTASSRDEEKDYITLKNWALEDRPREKLIEKGKKELSNAELIAILIGSGSVGQSAVDLAKEILYCYDNNLSVLSRLGIKDLTKGFKGMGEAKAVTIIAALELGYRMLTERNNNKDIFIRDSTELFNYISPSIIDLPTEEFWAIYLNNKNKVLFKQRIATGGLTEVLVDTRKLFSIALEKNASHIAVAHNHPSGSITPSKNDNSLTNKIVEAGKILNISVIEHIIVGIRNDNKPDYYSYRENGLIF